MLLLLRWLTLSTFGFDGNYSYTVPWESETSHGSYSNMVGLMSAIANKWIQVQVPPFPSCRPGTAGLYVQLGSLRVHWQYITVVNNRTNDWPVETLTTSCTHYPSRSTSYIHIHHCGCSLCEARR
jgi:hypothetical protein